jgi:hypothetical protein
MDVRQYLTASLIALLPAPAFAADNSPAPHSGRFLWQGLDPATVSDASIIKWVSENCSAKPPVDQVKKAEAILDATKAHPMSEQARTWVRDGYIKKYGTGSCDQLNTLLSEKEPF